MVGRLRAVIAARPGVVGCDTKPTAAFVALWLNRPAGLYTCRQGCPPSASCRVWTVREKNRLLAICFGLSAANVP